MARKSSALLDTNDLFPELELQLLSGETLQLPEATGEGYGIVLFYRGHW
jgi:peroxiredoxin